MSRLILIILAIIIGCASSARAVETSMADVSTYVERFNPDIFKLNPDGTPVYAMRNAFSTPASDIARDVADNNWFNLFVYMPFLILPQVLLLVVIFKFRDRGDGRKPATFMTHHTLEMLWTAIPCLALVIVSVPVWHLLYKMELPPMDVDTNNPNRATIVKITGKQFSWDYEYKHEGISIGTDPASSTQDALVLVKDRAVVLNMTSNDVNHAWWVPAFGVKKDAFKGRYTNTWFTPTELGVFKGNCAELCGEGHGIMFISSVVVTPDDFEVYKLVQRHRADTFKVWMRLQAKPGAPAQESEVKAAVDKYFEKDGSPARRFALKYWIATNFAMVMRRPQDQNLLKDLERTYLEKIAMIDRLITARAVQASPVAVTEGEDDHG
jgi:cytochrome c oxidase subunit II